MADGNLTLVSDISLPAINETEANQLVKVQRDILKIIVECDDFQHALDSLCKAAEGIVDGSLASIMLFADDRKSLKVRSSPNLTLEAIDMLNGLIPSDESGSCGTAVFKGLPQFVSDTSIDSRWNNHQSLVKDLNIHACWSMPIKSKEGRAIGSFGLSSFEKRAPSDFQKNLLQTVSYLAGMILQREDDHNALQQAAHYDHLTKLPNRFLFKVQAEQAIARANRIKAPLSLFYIDLDNFKSLNDKLGHDIGDEVLFQIAKRMNASIRREDSLARIGGDEFVLLVESAKSHDELVIIAEKLLSTFDAPLLIESEPWDIRASIGISRYPKDGVSIDELLRNSDKAMYVAKSKNHDKIQFFSN